MTEIPEHLLKRSKAAKGQKPSDSSDDAGEAKSAAPVAAEAKPATPAAPTASFPDLDPEPPPAPPDPPYVQAAKARKRVPVWAMPVIAALPIWALFYAGTMQLPDVEDPLLVDAALIYDETGGCAGCHGADGQGISGNGYQLSEGEVIQTFPNPVDQMVHVARGSAAISGQAYGLDGRRISGERGVMPAQDGALSQLELELVIYHERAILSGEEEELEPPFDRAYEEWGDHLRERIEAGEETPIDIDFLLACADPAITPGATGEGSPNPEDQPCPGPNVEELTE